MTTLDCLDVMDYCFINVKVVWLVVSVVPVEYMYQGQKTRTTFWVETVIPMPSVNLIKCIKCLVLYGIYKDTAHLCQQRHNMWSGILYRDVLDTLGLTTKDWDLPVCTDSMSNYKDRKHQHILMNSIVILWKILQKYPDIKATPFSKFGSMQLLGYVLRLAHC